MYSAAEQDRCPPPGAYKYLRYDEDYQYLGNVACRSDALDQVKYVPLGSDEGSFVSFGGEIRQTMEYFNNASWGQGPQSDPYSLQRYMGHFDLHWTNRFRLFGQVKSGIELGRNGGPRVFDEDKFDLNQAFVDVGLSVAENHSVTVRAGRQELAYGATRFVSVREGPTVHAPFDAARVIVTVHNWRADFFASKPVETNTGVIDDYPDPTKTFWGAYATGPLRWKGSHIDFYYFGLERAKAKFQLATAREERHSIGTRLWGTHNNWDYDIEPLVQFGSFGSGNIHAWALESEGGYTFKDVKFSPRVASRTDVDSGNHDPHGPNLGSFYPMFPRGLYHQLVNLNGHVNFVSFDPLVVLHLRKNLTLTQDWDFFWRESLNDGIYGVGGNFLRPGLPDQGRYIGSQPSSVAIWRFRRHWEVVLIYTHFFPGPFLENSGPHEPVNYVSTWLDFKF
jgi:hypothetical protein